MACPLFLPVDPRGDYYAGECAAARGERLSDEMLRQCCNAGYARGMCERAAEVEGDAVRFVLKADRAGELELNWSLERNHHPLAVGSMALPSEPVTPLEFQAWAFGAAYFRHRAPR